MRLPFVWIAMCSFLIPLVAQQPAKDASGDPLPKGAIARLGSERMRAFEGGSAILHPDGKRLIGRVQGTLQAVDVTTGAITGPFSQGENDAVVVNFSADGTRALSWSYEGAVVWDCGTGKTVWESKLRSARGGVLLSGNGKFLGLGGVSNDEDKKKSVSVSVYDVDGKKEVASLKVAQNSSAQLLLSSDGKRGVTWGYHAEEMKEDDKDEQEDKADTDPNRRIQFWDIEKKKEIASAQLPGFNVSSISIAPAGDRVAVSDGGGLILLYDTATGKLVRQFIGRRTVSEQLTFSSDGKSLAASGNSVVQVWDVASGKSLGVALPPAPSTNILSMVFTAADRLVVHGQVGVVHVVWEAPSGKQLSPLVGHQQAITGITFAAGDKEVVTSSYSEDVTRWDTAGKKLGVTPLRAPGVSAEVYGRTRLPFGAGVVVRENAGAGMMVYDTASGNEKFTVPTGYTEPPFAVTSDGKHLLLGLSVRNGPKTTAAKLVVIDMATGTKMTDVPLGNGMVQSLVVSSNGKRAGIIREASDDEDRESKFFVAIDLEAGKVLGETKVKGFHVPTLAAAVDNGTALGAHPETGELITYDLNTAKLGKNFGGKVTATFGPVFSPDGKRVAIATGELANDSEIVVFDYETGKKTHTFKGHINEVTAIVFSADSKMLATGSEDTTVLLWDLVK